MASRTGAGQKGSFLEEKASPSIKRILNLFGKGRGAQVAEGELENKAVKHPKRKWGWTRGK